MFKENFAGGVEHNLLFIFSRRIDFKVKFSTYYGYSTTQESIQLKTPEPDAVNL